MSYQVLARKWRPAAFEEMVGQSHVLHALTNALGQQRLHHAYLFTGTRGVGKTSIARLFAKGLNCEQGVTAKPCGTCSSCVEIAQGRFVDLIEVDAASRTKVDDTRELLDNVQYRPTRGRFKVYLIDEVHMLSRSSFNALLKTLEEPPEHVKFLLATTDPQKLPVTVLSRCLQFNLKSLSQDEISQQLSHVLSKESIPAESQALTLLAKAANGSMRDGLSLTDQAIAFGAGSITLAQVQTMLGSIDERHVLGLFEALVSTDIQQVLKKVAEVLAFGADAAEVLRSLLELLHQITLTQFAPTAAQMSLYEEQIKAFANQLNPEQVQLYYQILLSGRKELAYAPDPKSGLEMALMRVIAFSPVEGEKSWSTEPSVSRFSQTSEPLVKSESSDEKIGIAEAGCKDIKAEESETEEENDEQLLAEQALILSQAQSQGFNATEKQAELQGTEVEQPEAKNTASETLGLQAIEPEKIEAQALDAKLDVANAEGTNVGRTKLQETRTEQSKAVESEVAKTPPSQAPLVSNSGSQTQTDTASQVDESRAEVNDVVEDTSDDNVPLSLYDNAAHDDSSDEYYAPFEEVNAPQSYQAPVSQDTAAKEVLAQGGSQTTSSSEPPLGDDLLDAVLAARDSLLSDVERDAPKDGDTKKLELSPSVAAKRALPSDANYQVSAERAQVQELEQEKASEQALLSQDAEQHSDTQELHNEGDRPPWEPQPEVSSIEAQEDKSNALLSAEALPLASDSTLLSVEAPTEVALISSETNTTDTNSTEAKSQEVTQRITEQVGERVQAVGQSQLPATQIVGNEIDLHWYKLMAKLDIGGRVRQLAVNSLCLSLEMPIRLLLKPNQKHLSAEIAIKQLRTALENALEQECQLDIQVGTDPERETPLEIRKRFHQEILGQTQAALFDDNTIQWLQQNMSAELDVDSLSYPPELLAARSGQIESLSFIPESNNTDDAS